ncbi:MAG: hypothetical protein U0Y68_17600 [Blastocatellia bacterium]
MGISSPHGQAATSPYWQLPTLERQLLLPKLLGISSSAALSADFDEQAAARLHTLIYLENLHHSASDKLLTLQNFARQMQEIPAAWAQVHRVVGVARSYLEMTVNDHAQFLAALRAADFAVNSWMEKVSRWAGHGHRFDSARARTEHRYEPQLHLVNDRADEPDYGPQYFFVHWDAQSVYARRGGLWGRIAAGRTHKHHTASPQEVHTYLDALEPRKFSAPRATDKNIA